MERNNREVQSSRELREGAEALVTRAADLARLMLEARLISAPLRPRRPQGASTLDSEPTG